MNRTHTAWIVAATNRIEGPQVLSARSAQEADGPSIWMSRTAPTRFSSDMLGGQQRQQSESVLPLANTNFQSATNVPSLVALGVLEDDRHDAGEEEKEKGSAIERCLLVGDSVVVHGAETLHSVCRKRDIWRLRLARTKERR